MRMLIGALCVLFGLVPVRAESVRIDFYTDWKAQAEHGGFYQALAKGYYKRRGLEVVIHMGGPQMDNPRLLAAGAIDVMLASNAFQPLNLVEKGVRAKAVMAAFQKDPQVFMTHPGLKPKDPAGLRGHPILVADSAVPTFWKWAKARFGYEDRQIRKYTYSLVPWLRTPNAVQEGYATSEPFTAEKAGVKPNVYPLADYGYPGYAAMVVVSEKFMKAHPDAVRAFVAASIEGWTDYMTGDPAPGNRLIMTDNKEMTPELITYGIRSMRRYGIVISGDATRAGAGVMTDARWKDFFTQMSALGIYPKTLDWRAAYTLDYLPKKAAK